MHTNVYAVYSPSALTGSKQLPCWSTVYIMITEQLTVRDAIEKVRLLVSVEQLLA